MAHRGFRPGHEPKLRDKKLNEMGLIGLKHPAEYIPFFPEYEDEFQLRKRQLRPLWEGKNFDGRLNLERDLLKLKGLRKACDCTAFAFQLDYTSRRGLDTLERLTKYTDKMTNEEKEKHILDLYNVTVDATNEIDLFNEGCTCTKRDNAPPIRQRPRPEGRYALGFTPQKGTEKYADMLLDELNVFERDYPDVMECYSKDEVVFQNFLAMPLIKRQIEDKIQECDARAALRLIVGAHDRNLEVITAIGLSKKLDQKDIGKLDDFQHAWMGAIIKEFADFDTYCTCKPKIKEQINETKNIRELSDNWKRRTLYRSM